MLILFRSAVVLFISIPSLRLATLIALILKARRVIYFHFVTNFVSGEMFGL